MRSILVLILISSCVVIPTYQVDPNEPPPSNETTTTTSTTTTTKLTTVSAGPERSSSQKSNTEPVDTTTTTVLNNCVPVTSSKPANNNSDTDGEPQDDHDDGHGSKGIILIPFHFTHVEYPLIISLVVIFAGLSKLAFHFSHFLSSKVPESCVLIVLGLIFGVILVVTGAAKDVKLFSPHEFFLFLLPPIILESAFSLHDRTFAENIGGVLLFAVVGTVLNCFLIGFTMYGLMIAGAMEDVGTSLVQMLVFSALIVAVDPVAVLAVFQEVGVNNTLYFLVFGESLLNDGVTVVLYNVMQIFNTLPEVTIGQIFLGIAKFFIVVTFGLLLGIICGLISSYITKFTNSVKVVEPLIVFGFAYLSYVLSELFEFSGIVSIIACGIIQVHYAFHNITNKSRLAIKFFAKVMATASEIIIFLFLGIVTIDQQHDWKTGFTLWALLLCILYRFFITYGIAVGINKFSTGRVRKISLDEMFMISYGGLRGAVCFSLVALVSEDEIPMKNMFVTTTLFVIFFTVFIQGGTIKWLVKKFRVKLAQTNTEMRLNEELSSHGGTIKWLVKKLRVKLAERNHDMNLNEELSNHVFDHVMAGIEEILGYTTGEHHIKEKLDHFDDTIIRPRILRNATKSELDDISHYYEKLVMKEHYKNLQLSGAKLPRVKTEIRHLDSELALDKLGHDEDEHEAHKRHEDLVAKRDKEHLAENKSHGDNIHKFFSHTMHTVRSRLHLKVHDKNLTHDHKHHLISHLRRKHRKNNVLRNLQTKPDEQGSPKPPPRSLSYNLDGTRAFEERKPSQVQFTISNTVYEEEDEIQGNNAEDQEQEEDGKVTFKL